MTDKETSPANGKPRVTDRTRVPLATGQQKLAIPAIPGYYLYWMLGKPDMIERAMQAGYTFVNEDEVSPTNHSLGGDAKKSGNSDMGTRVSVLAGREIGADGQPIRLYLMKLPEEWYQEDQKFKEQKSDAIRKALLQGQVGSENDANSSDTRARYVGRDNTNMFQPKSRRP